MIERFRLYGIHKARKQDTRGPVVVGIQGTS